MSRGGAMPMTNPTALITRVSVDTDRLLKAGADPKLVMITIRVTIKGFTATWGNLGMVG